MIIMLVMIILIFTAYILIIYFHHHHMETKRKKIMFLYRLIPLNGLEALKSYYQGMAYKVMETNIS